MTTKNSNPLAQDPDKAWEHPQESFEHAWAKNVHQFDITQAQPQHHEPYQEGPYVKCKTEGHDHGFWIGPLKQLVMRNGKLTIESVTPNQTPRKGLKSNNTLLYS